MDTNETTSTAVAEPLVFERNALVRVCQLAGYHTADQWNNEDLIRRAHNLDDDAMDKMKTEEEKELLNKVLDVIEKQEEFTVLGDVTDPKSEKSKSPNKTAKTVTVTNGSGTTTKTKVSAGNHKDKYGCKLGGIPSTINLAVTEVPSTVEEIAARCDPTKGITAKRVQVHFDVCTDEKKHVGPYLIKDKDGKYSVKPMKTEVPTETPPHKTEEDVLEDVKEVLQEVEQVLEETVEEHEEAVVEHAEEENREEVTPEASEEVDE